jgi:aminoglycoside phosphotransferase
MFSDDVSRLRRSGLSSIYPALTRWANFATRLRRWLHVCNPAHCPMQELEDWNRFGKVRQTYEKRLRDPDDVFIEAEQRKKELA